ncbi:hypothetical protein HYT23_04665 [Candidatus Pacearchaeota archaeon]|nr:hypothetical protein [Candidatus Pacearchaeota archaeon]
MAKTLRNIIEWLKERPVKTALTLGLAGLVSVTALKDNVHFGSVNINNPQENHYTWGLAPITTITEATNPDVNLRTFGIIFAMNHAGENSEVRDMSAYGGLLFGGNKAGDSSRVNDMSAYGLIFGVNDAGEGSMIENVSSRGIRSITPFGNRLGAISYLNNKNPVPKKQETGADSLTSTKN